MLSILHACSAGPARAAASPHVRQARSSGQLKVAVIGGGVGGLVTAGRIARAGHDVVVLEQLPQAGGRCVSHELHGCRFDVGPSLLLLKDKYEEAFSALGSSLSDHVDVQRVEGAAYRAFFAQGGGSQLDLLYDQQAMAEQLDALEAGAGRQYLAWLSDATAALRMGMRHFIEQDWTSLEDLRRLPGLLPLLLQVNPAELLGSHHLRLARRFKDKRLQALLSFQDLYVGLTPFRAPAVFSLLAATELVDGVHYPVGGFGKVRDGLQEAAEACGARVKVRAEVTGICTIPDGTRVTGVQLASGEVVAADVVVANRDLPAAYTLLRTPHGQAQHAQLTGKAYSAGILSFNWCLDVRLHQLLHHNVFLSEEYEVAWQRAVSPAGLAAHPNFYVHAPARTDPAAAPAGWDALTVLLPVGNIQETGTEIGPARPADDYAALIAAGREAVLRSLAHHAMPQVAAHIQHELVLDPRHWRDSHGIEHGAAFGLAHGLRQLSITRPSNRDSKVKGLYFVGASTRPGNGVPLVLIGAQLVADRILAEHGRLR